MPLTLLKRLCTLFPGDLLSSFYSLSLGFTQFEAQFEALWGAEPHTSSNCPGSEQFSFCKKAKTPPQAGFLPFCKEFTSTERELLNGKSLMSILVSEHFCGAEPPPHKNVPVLTKLSTAIASIVKFEMNLEFVIFVGFAFFKNITVYYCSFQSL